MGTTEAGGGRIKSITNLRTAALQPLLHCNYLAHLYYLSPWGRPLHEGPDCGHRTGPSPLFLSHPAVKPPLCHGLCGGGAEPTSVSQEGQVSFFPLLLLKHLPSNVSYTHSRHREQNYCDYVALEAFRPMVPPCPGEWHFL